MSQEDKELLLKDLCARLPYGVMCQVDDGAAGLNDGKLIEIDISKELVRFDADYYWDAYIDDVKPYLRPMTSMTEEEKREIYDWLVENDVDWFDFSKLRLDEILISFDSSWLLVNWLNSHHFDYRGLIEKGLAIEVTKENNPYV